MEITITIRGCSITPSDIQRIQSFMDEHPHWHRTKLSRELCIAWDWKTHNGQYKDMACRGLLLKLEKLGIITLPPRRAQAYNSLRNRLIHPVQHRQSPIHASLKTLVPLHTSVFKKTNTRHSFIPCLRFTITLAPRGWRVKI